MFKKKDAQRFHFRKRFKERTGKVCTRQIKDMLLKQVYNKELVIVEKQSNRILCLLTLFEGKEYIIVYDLYTRCLVTILYRSEFELGGFKVGKEHSSQAYSSTLL